MFSSSYNEDKSLYNEHFLIILPQEVLFHYYLLFLFNWYKSTSW